MNSPPLTLSNTRFVLDSITLRLRFVSDDAEGVVVFSLGRGKIWIFLQEDGIATFDKDKNVLKLVKDQHKNLASHGVP